MTVIELIESSASRMAGAGVAFGHGTTNEIDEAAWLVMWRLGLPLGELSSVEGVPVSPQQKDSVDALITERIQSRKPAAYLTREAWLQGVPFYVDERTIVPRSFIAELIAHGTFDAWLSEDTKRVLDLCTGNGSLAVLAALAFPEVTVDAADISVDALEVARINLDRHKQELGGRVTLLESDGLRKVRGPYDLILCNPPYVNAQSMAELPAEFLREPSIALAGGEDGMDFIRTLLRDAPAKMTEDAVLVLEIGNERENFERAFPRLDCVWLNTSAGSDQVLLVTRDALEGR